VIPYVEFNHFLNLNDIKSSPEMRQMYLPRGFVAAACGTERASMFLSPIHFLLIARAFFDATTAQIPVKGGFNIASLHDCPTERLLEYDGSCLLRHQMP